MRYKKRDTRQKWNFIGGRGAVDDPSPVGMVDGASMRTGRVDVAVRPDWSVATRRLKAVRPAACAVVDAGNFDPGAAHAIRNDIGGFRYDQLARAGNAGRCAEVGVFREETFETVENTQSDPFLRRRGRARRYRRARR